MIKFQIANTTSTIKAALKKLQDLSEKKVDIDELLKVIAGMLNIDMSEITSIEALGGLTNRNFKVAIGNEEFAVRIPGKGTEAYINRHDEKVNSEITSLLGINPEVIFFDEETGLKMVRYIPNAETLNPDTGKTADNLKMVAAVFHRLHTSGKTFNARFDVFEKITEYETILADLNGKVFEEHEVVKQQVLELKGIYQSLQVPLVPCHNDPLAENFVKDNKGRMYLVDWEFSGMNDPLWDIAAYIIEAELSSAEEEIFVKEYFNGEPEMERLLMNKIFLDFLWTIWALMKEAGGEDFGEYARNRFNRAKENLQKFRQLKNS